MPYDAPPFRRDDRPNGFLSGQANDITLYGTMQGFKTQYVVFVVATVCFRRVDRYSREFKPVKMGNCTAG